MNNTNLSNSDEAHSSIVLPLPGLGFFWIIVLVASNVVLWRKYWDKLQPTHVFELSLISDTICGGLYPVGVAYIHALDVEEPYLFRYAGQLFSLFLRFQNVQKLPYNTI